MNSSLNASSAPHSLGLSEPLHAVIIGGRSAVGSQLVQALARGAESQVWATGRSPEWVDADEPRASVSRVRLDPACGDDWDRLTHQITDQGRPLNCVIHCAGLLHDEEVSPERTWRQLDWDAMGAVFAANTLGPAMAIKHLMPLVTRSDRALVASLSARVGSIGDNHLGGWYSYRASKAAQNMMWRCAALEARRLYRKLVCVTLHPGTVASPLSAPFSSRVPEGKLFSPTRAADQLLHVLGGLQPADSGGFFAWDGQRIEW